MLLERIKEGLENPNLKSLDEFRLFVQREVQPRLYRGDCNFDVRPERQSSR